MSLTSTDSAKNTQSIVIIVVATVVCAFGVMLYMKETESIAHQVSAPKKIKKTYTTQGQMIDHREAWIERSENDLEEMKLTFKQEMKKFSDEKQDLINQMKLFKQNISSRITNENSQQNQSQQKLEQRLTQKIEREISSREISVVKEVPVNARVIKVTPKQIEDYKKKTGQANKSNEEVIQDIERLQLPMPAGTRQGQNRSSTAQFKMPDVTKIVNQDKKITKVVFKKKSRSLRENIRNNIPATFFTKAVMLSGVYAPTGGAADKEPLPVLFQIMDNGSLPNQFRHRAKECRVIGAAKGNSSDERVYIRVEQLTCILKNGEIISKKITATVNGEDGSNGIPGTLIEKRGAFIARALFSGVASGIGKGLSQSFSTLATTATGTVQSVNPGDIGKFGVAQGTGSTLEKLSEWYMERAEELYPVIHVSGSRMVDIFFLKDVELDTNLFERASLQ
jgi:hypothetical protein